MHNLTMKLYFWYQLHGSGYNKTVESIENQKKKYFDLESVKSVMKIKFEKN